MKSTTHFDMFTNLVETYRQFFALMSNGLFIMMFIRLYIPLPALNDDTILEKLNLYSMHIFTLPALHPTYPKKQRKKEKKSGREGGREGGGGREREREADREEGRKTNKTRTYKNKITTARTTQKTEAASSYDSPTNRQTA